ncbi:hypothetical protein FPZ24_08750 [Sphingomonas panacisoli]|uniref:DUF4386 family protein n=1 Tax=Sphingomonas panacisoli TaxID=1813879 RepID=A0A5B8LHI7_9SPHN|nr:hypothetical protein [Sphingomonas panacisoli]QDZ07563.1 hypothetical protein FPZ24_08750 [Sphingomonas panacisoli]
MTAFVRWSGLAFCVAAVTTLALNVLVSPHLPEGAFAVVAASPTYFLRQCIAAVVALLLVFGLVGLQISRSGSGGAFGTLAFVLALVGQITLFSVEYGQAFTVHDYALYAPNALNAAMADPHRPLALGALIAIGVFFIGWLLLAISLLGSRQTRSSAILIIVGLPLAFATKGLGVYGGMVASLVTGTGWLLLGLHMMRQRAA